MRPSSADCVIQLISPGQAMKLGISSITIIGRVLQRTVSGSMIQ